MAETIYTIPINEAFDECTAEEECRCPLCILHAKFENDELELILGASMMEPDVRIRTNEEGFCGTHYNMMLERKNRLGMALMLQSHLEKLGGELSSPGVGDIFSAKGASVRGRLEKLEESCYICGRVNRNFGKMLDNILHIWENDPSFAPKLKAQKMFCLPHFRELTALAAKQLSKKKYNEFYSDMHSVTEAYMSVLRGDIDHFCRKFDYRFQDEPWGNAKDSVERATRFLSGDEHCTGKS